MQLKLSKALNKAKNDRPSNWRHGQAVFNYTYELYPDIIDGYLRGTKYDCFHRKDLINTYVCTLRKIIFAKSIGRAIEAKKMVSPANIDRFLSFLRLHTSCMDKKYFLDCIRDYFGPVYYNKYILSSFDPNPNINEAKDTIDHLCEAVRNNYLKDTGYFTKGNIIHNSYKDKELKENVK